MNLTASITGDCRFMSISVTGATSQGEVSITVSNGSNSYPIAADANLSGNYTTAIYLSTTVGSQAGVFEVTATDTVTGTIAYAGALGKCDLDCCIAKKVDSLLGCDCACTKCNDTLIVAERVHLLIVAIQTELAQIGGDNAANTAIITNSRNKYNKALELCSDSCGCNC